MKDRETQSREYEPGEARKKKRTENEWGRGKLNIYKPTAWIESYRQT